MSLPRIKLIVSGLWMFTALLIALVIDASWSSGAALTAVGVLPPLALLFWWNEPVQTMSQQIRQAQQ